MERIGNLIIVPEGPAAHGGGRLDPGTQAIFRVPTVENYRREGLTTVIEGPEWQLTAAA